MTTNRGFHSWSFVQIRGRSFWIWVGIFAIGLAIRLPLLAQSQWYDEMFWRMHFMRGSWETVLAAPAGMYLPNNHVLYTIIAKCLSGLIGDNVVAMRLPSVLAGAGVGLALAWPLRKSAPTIAAFVAVFATFHPWLLAFSTEARGYALLLMLCAIATNLLPQRPRQVAWGYVLVMAAAIYTVPIAAVLLAGHGLAMLILRREALLAWLSAAVAAGVVAALLYLPMLDGMMAYWVQPHPPTVGYGEFLCASALSSVIGYSPIIAPALGVIVGLFVVSLMRAAWNERAFRPAVASFGGATAIALLAPLAVPSTGEARFALWLIPVVSLGLAVWLTGLAARVSRRVGPSPRAMLNVLSTLALAYAALVIWPISGTPAQPIRDALAQANELAKGRPVVGVYMASVEAANTYRGMNAWAYDLAALKEAADWRAVLIVLYERQLAEQEPQMLDYIRQHYQLARRLEGRVSLASIYVPKPQPASSPATAP